MKLLKQDQNTPFGHWWSLYGDHCPRMADRRKCKAIFDKQDLETQRLIYEDTRDRLKHYEDWQALNDRGKRKFMRMPLVYLRAAMWECPVDKKRAQGNVRDTTKETVRPEQDRAGLEHLRAMLLKGGHDTSQIDKQLGL